MSLPTNSTLANTPTALESMPCSTPQATNAPQTLPSASPSEQPQVMKLTSANLRKLDKFLREADLIMMPSKSTPPLTPVNAEVEPKREAEASVEAAITEDTPDKKQCGTASNALGLSPDNTEGGQVRVEVQVAPADLPVPASSSNELMTKALDLAKLAVDGMELANQAMAASIANGVLIDEQLVSQLESFRKLTENGTAQVTDALKMQAETANAATTEENRVNPLESDPRKLFANQKQYKCRNCPYISLTKEESWGHKKEHIPIDKQLFCQECCFVTEYKHHLEYHIRNHRSQFFKCSKCTYNTASKSMLDSHVSFYHIGPFMFQCMDCDFESQYNHRLKMHLSKHGHQKKPELNLGGDDSFEAYMDKLSTEMTQKL
uniref:C2H2-type domain-containing protein n=1 Tax=Panagrellus redivivus TaxID=6233 RepID=A0A7E4WDX5_PANRE